MTLKAMLYSYITRIYLVIHYNFDCPKSTNTLVLSGPATSKGSFRFKTDPASKGF